MKQRLLVSVSGGKTSAFLAHELWKKYRGQYEIRFVFANTGQELEATLVFVNRCDTEWELGIVWLEALAQDGRISSGHKIVTFETAARNGEPFEGMIQKYGIPNKSYPHCTRELKMNAIKSYAESIGWGDCLHAVGIRADEPDRVRADAEKERIVYPLAYWFPTTKPMINDWWADQPFQLGIMDYEGNCSWCWKKSTTKLVRIAREHPERFDFPARMEAQYGTYEDGRPRHFFRENRSTKDVLGIAAITSTQAILFSEYPDDNSGCSESCEPF